MANLLTQARCETVAKQAGWSTKIDSKLGTSPCRIIAAIAMCEGQTNASRLETERTHIDYSDFDAVGDQALATDYWGFSYSGLQIRSIRAQRDTGGLRDELRLPDPAFAFASALAIYKSLGFPAWSTFNNDMHKAYLQDVFVPPADVYIVKSGDTLGRIASTTQMGTWQDWSRVNQLHDPNLIFIGQRLFKPWIVHKVVAGDTLSAIVTTYGDGVTVAQVARFNALANPDAIAVGQAIRIPRSTL